MLKDTFRKRLYQYIVGRLENSGPPPSFADMTAAMGISPRSKSLLTRNLRRLEKEGKIMLAKDGRYLLISLPTKGLPLLGRISAGAPIEAIESPEDIDLAQMFQGEGLFALKVKGHSMIGDGIFDGDIIICKRASIAKEGEIVVALVDQQQATLKRISFKKKGRTSLLPANPEFKPQIYNPARVTVQGTYLGLIRRAP